MPLYRNYRVCHGFWLKKRDQYFWVSLDHFWWDYHFWGIWGSNKKLPRGWNQTAIRKINQIKLVQICEMLCMILCLQVFQKIGNILCQFHQTFFAKQKVAGAQCLPKKLLFNFTSLLPHPLRKFAKSLC